MLLSISALVLAAAFQSAVAERSRAEALARAGRSTEALKLFERIIENDPADTEARLWVARLALRLGRPEDAEAGFRSVLLDHPDHVDARIGLGSALIRMGASQDALEILRGIESENGDNADLVAALARAHRRTGDDHQALQYFQRARTLAPHDPDIASGFRDVARAHGHWVAWEGDAQSGPPGTDRWSGAVTLDARVTPRLHLGVTGRIQQGSGFADALAGGEFRWRAAPTTVTAFRVTGGPGNVALPRTDISGDIVHFAGAFEVGGNLRRLSFSGASILAGSPMFAWTPTDRWRLEARYTFSRSSFDQSGQTNGDHSMLVRQTWQGWRRFALIGALAHGIESFEQLTADRLGSLGATTLAGGLRIDAPILTRMTIMWEHQRRSDATRVDRLTLSIVRAIP